MSDHSTGSSGSSTNSWTILSPEEAAVETVGPDDGTESLSGVPGLPEEGTGVPIECDLSGTHAPAGPVLSEEGHQVCQETSPEVCEAAAFIDPSFSGFDEGEFDPEIHAPVIHDTITSSPPDSDLLGSTPFAITSEAALLFSEEEPAFAPSSSDLFADIGYGHEIPVEEFLTQERSTPEVLSEGSASPEAIPEESHTPEPFPQQSPSPEALEEEGPAPEVVALETAFPETLVPESFVPEVPLERSPTPDISLSEAPEAPEFVPQESPTPEPQTEWSPTPEPLPTDVAPDVSSAPVAPDVSPAPVAPDVSPAPMAPDVSSALVAPAPDLVEALSQSVPSYPASDSPTAAPEPICAEESPAPVGLEPETITSASAQLEEEEEEEEEPPFEEKEAEVPEEQILEPEGAEPVEEVIRAEPAAAGDGLRLRHAMPPEPLGRSSEDEEEEEEEFHLAERREEKRGFALNKLIVGSLVLLCLGSLFFSDDGFDGSEVTEQELLERLAQENQQIAKLETQLQSQKEALDQALRAATENLEIGSETLKEENVKLKEELATLPGLKEELESLRARVAELSQLTVWESETIPASADPVTPPDQPETANQIQPEQGAEQENGGDGLKAALQRQKSLLEDSRRRLAVMKKSAGKKKGVREGLVDMQKRLSEQAERLDKRHDWKRKQRENEAMKDQGRKWEGKKGQGNKWGGKKERDEQWEDKNRQSSQWESKKGEHTGQKDGKKEHGNKWEGKKEESEKWRGERDGKHGKDGKDGEQSKSWKKYHEDWDGRKHERKMEREKRKSQREWDAKSLKKSSSHHHDRHQHHQDLDSHEKQNGRKYEHASFWQHQEQKLRRNPGPTQACSGAARCAEAEGLVAVELLEFQALLEGYLGKLPASTSGGKEELQRLTAGFFPDGVFDHERLLFSDFAEDVADILEDLADMLENESLEEEMEEFEREALWKFAAAAAA